MNRCKKCKKFCNKQYCSDKCNPNSKDELSPFKRHLSNAKKRARKKNIKINITTEDLKYIWEKQNGICRYTGWQLINSDEERVEKKERLASLDRIDSRKGYIRGNVQFVSYIAQISKNMFPETTFLNFCETVTKYKESNGKG